MATVAMKNITKKFGDFFAVKDFNLQIEEREFLVLVGPSGCGKSTTLRMVAGLESISGGELYIKDVLVNDVAAKDRDIAMVFQSYALYPHMNVFDNMAFGLKMRNVARREIRKRVLEGAEILGIQDLLSRKPKQLSGGQRQRVALGRAIVRDPDVFLFDEPLSNLDAKLRVQTRTELAKLHKRLRSTSIYVTHDQVEAMTMGDRIVVMNQGLIQQIGTPLDLYNHPVNRFVAGFIGSPAMNFLEARVLEEGGRVYVATSGFKTQLPPKTAAAVREAGENELIFGLRPEDIDKKGAEKSKLDRPAEFRAAVNVIETLGKETYVDITTGSETMIAVVGPNTPLAANGETEFVFNLDRIHLFSQETGRRISPAPADRG